MPKGSLYGMILEIFMKMLLLYAANLVYIFSENIVDPVFFWHNIKKLSVLLKDCSIHIHPEPT